MDSSVRTTIETNLIVGTGYHHRIKEYLVKIRLNEVIVTGDADPSLFRYELIFNNPKDYMIFQLRGGLEAMYNYVRVEEMEELFQSMAEEMRNEIDREILDQLYREAQYRELAKDL